MNKLRTFWQQHWQTIVGAGVGFIVIVWLLSFRLGSLTDGLSTQEATVYGYRLPYLLSHALNAPLTLTRFIFWQVTGHPGQTLTRLPNTLFGLLAIACYALVVTIWHGRRTAILATTLFATSAWVLHVSRLASNDVLYLLAIPVLLLLVVAAHKRQTNPWLYYGAPLLWGVALYVPGLLWLIIASAIWQRHAVVSGWQHFAAWWQRALYVGAFVVWLPSLILTLLRPGYPVWRVWLGLPVSFSSLSTSLHYFGTVLANITVQGPNNPELWLGKLPILDAFTLVMFVFGVYFYARHWRAVRSRMLASYFVISYVLVSLHGPVGLSLLVPLLYLVAATGIAFFLHEWLRVFPLNPIARSVGLSVVVIAVMASAAYNLRAYFIAWPHSQTTEIVFVHHTRD